MPDLALPRGYRERLPRSWQPWLDQLPELVASFLERWELTVVGELPLATSYVVPVERTDGRACVLKLQPTDVPGTEGAARELVGLRLGGTVAVEVLDEDAANGVLLLERAMPGTTLEEMAEGDDDAASELLARVVRDYGRTIDDAELLGLRPFEELAEAFERFDRGPHGDVARRRAAAAPETRLSVVLGLDEVGSAVRAVRPARVTAERVLTELLADRGPRHLLHGDLHHGNVLLDEHRGPRVIDPWGLAGDPSADVAPLLANPARVVGRVGDLDALVRRRLSIVGGVLEADPERLTAWCYVYSVIRALWALEDDAALPDDDPRVRAVGTLRTLI